MKKCTKCNNLKEYNEFNKFSRSKDGHYSKCKTCRKDFVQKNKESIAKQQKEYREKNKLKLNEQSREYYNKNKKELLMHYKEVYKENKEIIKNRVKKYAEKNKNLVLERRKRFREKHKKELNEDCRKWKKVNSDKTAFHNANRRAKKKQATPPWLNEKQKQEIKEFYILAKELQWLSEDQLQVDHIEPLQGNISCGLHVPWNLQIIGRRENSSKNNKLMEK